MRGRDYSTWSSVRLSEEIAKGSQNSSMSKDVVRRKTGNHARKTQPVDLKKLYRVSAPKSLV